MTSVPADKPTGSPIASTQDRSSGRPTIGFLTVPLIKAHQSAMWAGVADAAREGGAHAICFPAGKLSLPDSAQAGTGKPSQRQVLYELVMRAEKLDGLVIWGQVGSGLQEFIERLHPLPVVTISLAVKGTPAVLTDNYDAMSQLVTHLIETHGCQRIAFIRSEQKGYPEHEERYRAYLDVVAENGLILNPQLVIGREDLGAPGQIYSGEGAVHTLLDQRHLQPSDFDAVVANNERYAIQAQDALQARGIQVPDQVAIAAFDDDGASPEGNPPITSVPFPAYQMGQKATELLLAQLAGQDIAEQVTISTELAIRQSCGCPSAPAHADDARRTWPIQQRDETLIEISQALSATSELEGIAEVLAQELPRLKITSCHLALYENPQEVTGWARLVMAYHSNGRIALAPEGLRFPSPQLVPQSIKLAEEKTVPDCLVIEALYSPNRQIGFVLLGVNPHEAGVCEALRGYISSALYSATLLEEHRQEQSLMNALMDRIPDTIYFKDAQSRFIKISRSQAERFDLSDPDQAVGKTDFDFFSEEHARPAYEDEQRIIRTGQAIVDLEEKETWPDGHVTWVSTSKLPLRDEAGQIVGTFGISSDITARKQAEEALAHRAMQLQIASEVAHATSSILDPNELIQQVVELIREQFNLYYAGLFLVDQTGAWTGEPDRWAVLRAGTGEAGRQMLAQEHKLEIGGESMIGSCIATKQARIALDVGKEAVRFNNPFLPETHSEMALPLVSRDEAIGALTIQSTREAAFSSEDVAVLQTMASQVANAITNARLFDETQRRVARERTIRQITDRLQRSTDLESLMRVSSEELNRALGGSRVYVQLGLTPQSESDSQQRGNQDSERDTR
jgi:PAS domain S-box-containing protein